MKIIHLVLGKANPNRMNGVNKLVYEMVSTQHAMGLNVELWGISPYPVHNYPERNFKTLLFQSQKNKFSIAKTIQVEIDLLQPETVFHFHGSFIPEFYHIAKQLTKKGIPYVYTPHGALAPAAMKRSSWKKKIYFQFFEYHLIKNAAAMIATGNSVYANIQNLSRRFRRRVLIPNGQPLIPRSEFNPKKEQMIFGFCGRIALEHKGLDLLLEGYKIYLDQGGKAELHFIGGGAELKQFKSMAKNLGVLPKLTFYGPQFGGDKIKLLSLFDVFVHTSRMEGFPAAVLEAAAIGLPVMISRHTNVWEYVDRHQCGFLVDPNTPENIAYQMLTIEKLYLTTGLKTMSENAKRMISENFDWKHICQQLYDEYVLALKHQQHLATTH